MAITNCPDIVIMPKFVIKIKYIICRFMSNEYDIVFISKNKKFYFDIRPTA